MQKENKLVIEGLCLTIQEVSGTQVYVNAGVEAWDEPVEGSFLHTLTWGTETEKDFTTESFSISRSSAVEM